MELDQEKTFVLRVEEEDDGSDDDSGGKNK